MTDTASAPDREASAQDAPSPPAAASQSGPRQQIPGARQQALLREVTTTLLITIVLFLGLRYSAQAVPLDGPSMQPGLHSDERVLVNSLAYVFRAPQRGDVIVFHPPDALNQRYIKRVIGVPGDTIQLTVNDVYVNNVRLNEPYVAPTPKGYSNNPEPEVIHLGVDQYFVMGDNRTNSQDSRYFGPISRREIIGKAEFVVWPLSDAHDIATFPDAFAAIPSRSGER
jgi:signal peptidase I